MSSSGQDDRNEGLDILLRRASKFHGHLGPYLVIGVRMGLLAKKTLNCNGFKGLHAIVDTGSTPPLSCVVDGIQVATGCTLGKGNITVRNCDSISAIFHSENRRVRVEIKADTLQSLEKELVDGDADSLRETAGKFCSIPEPKLFSIEELQ